MKGKLLLPDLGYLDELFKLDFSLESGLIRRPRDLKYFKDKRARNTYNTRYANKMAGGKNFNGYYHANIDGVLFYCHRIVYSMFHRVDLAPHYDVDHIDRNKSNNHPSNLRLATDSQNTLNSTMRPDNFSGVVGVFWHKKRNAWISEATIDGKRKQLVQSKCLETAVMARYRTIKDLDFDFFGPQFDPSNPEAARIFQKIKEMELLGEI